MSQKETEAFEFPIYDDIADFPLEETPSFIKEGIVAICLEGSATVELSGNTHPLEKNNLLILLPQMKVCLKKRSDDFRVRFFKVPAPLFNDTVSGVQHIIASDLYFWLWRHCTYRLDESEAARFLYYLELIRMRAEHTLLQLRKDSVIHLLHIFYFDLYLVCKTKTKTKTKTKKVESSCQENIAHRFASLVAKHYHESRQLQFYAKKMDISARYLSKVIAGISGCSAMEWIDNITLCAIKGHLQNFTLSVREVAVLTGFHTQRTLSLYCKRHMGMSPIGFRNQFHGIMACGRV